MVDYMFSTMFAPWAGTIFADLLGLDLPLEVEIYYLEHILGLVVLPVIMVL